MRLSASAFPFIRHTTNTRGSVLTELALSLPLFFLMIPAITTFASAHESGQGYVGAAKLAAKEVSDASLLDPETPCRNLELIAESEVRLKMYITNMGSQASPSAEVFSVVHEFNLPQLPGTAIGSPETISVENFFVKIAMKNVEDQGMLSAWRSSNNLASRSVSVTFPLAGACSYA